MECNNCTFKQNDIISLNTSFGPGTYTLTIDNGDLTPKIFRGPNGHIFLPEAEFEIEHGDITDYLITNVEGILKRMIHWAEYMKSGCEKKNQSKFQKVTEVLGILNECLTKKRLFHIILKDTSGSSYISCQKEEMLKFEAYVPEQSND
ncbi:MAG: hypothetical protein ACTSWY_05960, partial [Promethearchaeota archaeon]